MNTRVMKRIEILEKRLDISAIPASERFLAIPFPDGNHAEFDRQFQQRLSELRDKYGNVSERDVFAVGIRKFSCYKSNKVPLIFDSQGG